MDLVAGDVFPSVIQDRTLRAQPHLHQPWQGCVPPQGLRDPNFPYREQFFGEGGAGGRFWVLLVQPWG